MTSWTHRSRSSVLSRCSTASSGKPLASYQSAARRWSFGISSGSTRRSSAGQELPVESVVAVPLAAPVEGHQELVGGLEIPQVGLGARTAEDGVAERAGQLVEDRRPAQEVLDLVGLAGERLPIEVVGDVPVVAGDGQCGVGAGLRDRRRQVEADRPALGPLGDRVGQLRREVDLGGREDLLGPVRRRGPGRRPRSPAPHPRSAPGAGAAVRDGWRRRTGTGRASRP